MDAERGAVMHALTVYQPWASLIILGAKPWEFRRWDYRARRRDLVDKRIVIHASARAIKLQEIEDIVARIAEGNSALEPSIALPLLNRIRQAYKGQGVVELSAGLGTARIGAPRRVGHIFKGVADSDRLDHTVWGWPLHDITPFSHPVPRRGAQGFWKWDAELPTE